MSGTSAATFVLGGLWMMAALLLLISSGALVDNAANDPQEAEFTRIVINTTAAIMALIGATNLAAAFGIHMEQPWGAAVAYAAIPINLLTVIGAPWAITHMVTLKR